MRFTTFHVPRVLVILPSTYSNTHCLTVSLGNLADPIPYHPSFPHTESFRFRFFLTPISSAGVGNNKTQYVGAGMHLPTGEKSLIYSAPTEFLVYHVVAHCRDDR